MAIYTNNNKVANIYIGDKQIVAAYIDDKQIYDIAQVETNTVTCSFDTTGLSGVRVTNTSGTTITSLVVNQGSTAQFELRPLNSNYNSFTNVNQGSATESDADLSGITEQLVSGNLRYTVSAVDTLTSDQTATITVTGTRSLIGYSVNGTATASLTHCTLSVDGDTTVPYEVNETRTGVAGGTFSIVATPDTNYEFTAASDLSITNLNQFSIQSGPTLNSNGTISATISYPAGSSAIDDDFNVTATASAIVETFTISFVDDTGANMALSNTDDFEIEATVGQPLDGGRAVTFTAGYEAATLEATDDSSVITTQDDDVSNVSWTGTMPSGGGSATITVEGTAQKSVYDVTGTATVAETNCTIVVDGGSGSSQEVSETRTVTDGGTFTITATPDDEYEFSVATDLVIQNVSDFTIDSRTLNDDGTITATLSYPAGTSDIDDDFNVSATATQIEYTFTISFVDSTGSGMSISEEDEEIMAVAGGSLDGNRSISVSSGRTVTSLGATDNSSVIDTTDNNSSLVSWTGTMPSGGGSATITVTGSTTLTNYTVSGTVTASLTGCTISVDGDTSAPYTFSRGRTVNSGNSFNIILTATSGNEFTNANNATVSGLGSQLTQGTNVLSGGGSTITIPISIAAGASNVTDNFTVTATATQSDGIAFPNVNLAQDGAAQCITPTTNTGSGNVTFTNVPSWLTIEAGGPENGCGSGTWEFDPSVNSTYVTRSQSVTANKGSSSDTFTVSQAGLPEFVTLGTPTTIAGPSGSTGTVSYTEGGDSTVTCSVSDTTNYSCSVNNSTNVVTVTAKTQNGNAGNRNVTLTVNKGTASDTVVFSQASNVSCSFNSVTITGATSANLLANVNLSVVNTNNGNCGTVTYSWTIVSGSGIFVGGQTGSSVTVRGTGAGTLQVRVTATGTGGVTSSDTHNITINAGGGFPP